MTNLEYRASRGTDKPFDYNPTARERLRRQHLEKRERENAGKDEVESPPAKPRPARRVKERKRISSNGRVLICSTGM